MLDFKKSKKALFILIAIICSYLVIAQLVGLFSSKKVYQITPLIFNKCFVLDCPPASWETILDIAFSYAEDNYQVDLINVLPTYEGRFTEVGPEFLTIIISYISHSPDESTENPIDHSMKYVLFEDRSQSIEVQIGGFWTSMTRSEEYQKKISEVKIHPRDVFEATWILAMEEISLSPENAKVSALLLIPNRVEQYGCDSIWLVDYTYYDVYLQYVVDAITGDVTLLRKNYFDPDLLNPTAQP